MITKDIKYRIDFLREDLNRHNRLYYVENKPEISDKEFDMRLKELESLEKEYPQFYDELSPTQRVGSDLTKSFEHVTHSRPMLSLSNTYSLQEVNDWISRIKKLLPNEHITIVSELKFDGTSISLTYKHGRLVKAVTRGDGVQGDDVTANVKTIKSIPLQLAPGNWPEEFEIRGEILMPWNSFEELNKERELTGENLFANPRNAASGTLKLLDPKEVSRRKLDATFYFLLSDDLPYDSHYKNMQAAKSWGFKISDDMGSFESDSDFDSLINQWDKDRHSLPVATDGMVFKVNSIEQQERLGFTAKSPRWAIAYKFDPEEAETPLKFVSFETGRMGTVTPVANLEPVQLSGSVVKRATLHNEDYIKELDLHENDIVCVQKTGEIIPQITKVREDLRKPDAKPIEFPKYCPSCGSELVRDEGNAAWVCKNSDNCKPQILGKIEHFCSRKMMDIDGLGPETIADLYDRGLIENTADIYLLCEEDMTGEGMGEKTAHRIILGIETSKSAPFHKVLYALSMPNVGETTSKRLASYLHNIDNLLNATVEELTNIPDIGNVVAESIVEYIQKPENIKNIRNLEKAGLNMSVPESEISDKENTGSSLSGKVIVISGTFEKHSRDEYKSIIEKEGGKNSGSISKKTSFVLAGDNMGPSKKDKCEELGIPMITEEEFLKMIGEN